MKKLLALAIATAFSQNFILAQTATLSEPLNSFSILSGTSVTSKQTTTVEGSVGAIGTVDSTVIAKDTTLQGSVCVTQRAMDSLTAVRSRLASAQPAQTINATTLSNTTLTSGVRNFSSSLLLDGTITLTGDSTSIFIFNVSGKLTFDVNTQLVLSGGVKSENVFFNVDSSVAVKDSATICGNILADGTICCFNDIYASGTRLMSSDSVCLINIKDTLGITPNTQLLLAPTADAGNDTTIFVGQSIQIGNTPVAGLTYSWSPAMGLSSSTIANPMANPSVSTTYTLNVTDANGCTSNDIVSITILIEECGADYLRMLNSSDSTAKANFDSVRVTLFNQISNFNQQNPKQSVQSVTFPNSYIIPVVVHLVGGVANNITDAQILQQITRLNDAFANQLASTNPAANDVQVQFCLAQNLPNGTAWNNISAFNPNLFYTGTAGITRCTTAVANTVAGNHNMDPTGANSQQALTNVVNFNPGNYLNIWVVNSISLASSPYYNNVLGYSPYPLMQGPSNGQYLDGVVMRDDAFGNPSTHPLYNAGLVLVHEVGHYLFLWHTFQFACNEVTNGIPCNALGGGDECCDTPPVIAPNQNNCSPNNSCFESPDLPDQIENYMDYAFDIGGCKNTYTYDQAVRMRAAIQTFRPNLVSYQNLLITGVLCLPSGLNPTFVTNQPNGSTQFCTFPPSTYGYLTAPGATSYSWTFQGGSPSTSIFQNPTGIQYTTPGVYNTTLTVADASGNTLSSTIQVFVTNCNPISGPYADWYFGNFCRVSFTSGIPQPIFEPMTGIFTSEASANISDNSGNIRFYSNGQAVWDATHFPTPNGNYTLNGSPNSGSDPSNAQGVVIIPRPSFVNRYYILPTSDKPNVSNIGNGVSLYEVDMTLNGGLGDVISTTPVFPTQNYATTEPILAIPHCNGQDYWVIVKPVNNNQPGLQNPGPLATVNDKIAAYLITSAGIGGQPVLSNSGPFIPTSITNPPGNNWIGFIVVSPDRKFVVFGDLSGNGYVYYFDCGNGTFEYLTTLNNISGYGGCFSPNSKIFYAGIGATIRQFDFSNISICQQPPVINFAFLPPNTNPPIPGIGAFQLGPDNKIYIARQGNSFNPSHALAVINFPNIINISSVSNDCGYNYNGVYLLSSQFCRLNLPNDIIASNNPIPDDFSFCIRNCGEACFVNMGCGTNFTWNFGDGYSITGINGTIPAGTNNGTTTGNFEYPCHTYAGPGSYNVSLSIDGRPVVMHTVNIVIPPPPVITGPNPVCINTGPLSYFGPSGYLWNWTATNGTPTSGTNQTFNVTWTNSPATLALTITDPATGCTNSSNTIITVNALPTATISYAGSPFCATGTANVTQTGQGGGTYSSSPVGLSITPSTGAIDLALSQPGTYVVTYIFTDANGCSNTTTTSVTIYALPTATISYSSPTFCATGTANVIQTGQGGGTYSSSPPGLSINTSTGVINLGASTPGTYVVTYSFTDANGCSNTTTTSVTVTNCCPTTCTPLGPTISSSPPAGGSYCINSNTTITGTNVIFAGSEFIIAPNVTITINPNCKLEIRGSHLYGCPNMWQGIVISPAGARLVINSNSLIEDAIVAVSLNNSSIFTGNNIIDINGSIFNKNRTGIQISNYSPPNLVTPMLFSIRDAVFTCRNVLNPVPTWPYVWSGTSAFKNLLVPNTLQEHYSATNFTAATLKTPFSGQPAMEGIKLSNLGPTSTSLLFVEIAVGDGTSNSYLNLFDNVVYGIKAADANFTVYNSAFQYMAVTGPFGNTGGIGIYAENTLGGRYRARALPSSGQRTNKFYDCRRAIEIHNCFEAYINSANVRSTQTYAPFSTINPKGDYGFFVKSNAYNKIDVLSNTITNIRNGVVFIADAIGSSPTQSQYVGPVSINSNTIQAQLPGPIDNTRFVSTAISATDVISLYCTTCVSGSPGTNIDVNANTLTDVFRGISMANWQKQIARSNGNSITTRQQPPFFSIYSDQYGIKHANNQTILNTIFNNNIQGTSSGNDKWRGIWADQNSNQLVRCNNVSNVGIGRGIEFMGGQLGTTFFDNTMSNLGKGYVLLSGGVIGQQGNSTNAMDDVWVGSWTAGTNYKTFTDGSINPTSSKIFVRFGGIYNPTSVSGPTGYNGTSGTYGVNDYMVPTAINVVSPATVHFPCPGGNPNIAANPNCPNCESADLIQAAERIAQDSISFTFLPNESRFITKNNLFRTLKEDSALRNGSVILQNFFATSQNTSRGTFTQIENDLKKNDFTSANSKVTTFAVTNTIENNYKTFYSVYINHKTNGSISNSDSSSLFNLSNSCPAENGSVVYQARALFNSVYNMYREFEDNCLIVSARMQQNSEKGYEVVYSKYVIYPNPTVGEIFVMSPYVSSGSLQITITDVAGKKTFNDKLIIDNNITKFNVDLSDGVYLLRLTNILDGESTIHKLVIQK